jgi:hypothetical protein
MDLYPFKSKNGGIEPVALPGYYVNIQFASENHYHRVTWYESIPPFQFLNLGAILAGLPNANPTAATNLELDDNEFGQFRWYPIDPIQVTMWLPSANGKYKLKNLMVPVDKMVIERDPCLHLTEFFVWEDNAPFFQALNYADYNLAVSRLVGMGFRYKLETDKSGRAVQLDSSTIDAIQRGTIPCTVIPASGRVK